MHYFAAGRIPEKRHIQFRKPDGELYHEELFSTEGFHDKYSLLYHLYPPTRIVQVGDPYDVSPVKAETSDLKPRCLEGFNIKEVDDYLDSRKVVLFNADCNLILAAPRKSMNDYFFKNADSDEMLNMGIILLFQGGLFTKSNSTQKRIAYLLLNLMHLLPLLPATEVNMDN